MATPEGLVKTWLIKQFEIKYPTMWYYKTPGGIYGRGGVPDLLFAVHGLLVALEVKTDKGKLTGLQKHELNKLLKAGCISDTIYGRDNVKLAEIFRQIDDVVEVLSN